MEETMTAVVLFSLSLLATISGIVLVVLIYLVLWGITVWVTHR